jgi:hypothetical protein
VFASVLTFIANRENGSMTFGDGDSRKLVTGLSNVPEIYSIKESENGRVAVGSNIINSDNALIPLGLSTSWTGNMKFTFTGMDDYQAQITFRDILTNKEIDITGRTSYEYPFNYAPAKDENNKPVATENRFFIQLSPAAPTGLIDIDSEAQVVVYNENRTIQIVSTSSNPIQQVFVYDMRGVLLYANDQINASHFAISEKNNSAEVILVKVVTEKSVKNVKLISKRKI